MDDGFGVVGSWVLEDVTVAQDADEAGEVFLYVGAVCIKNGTTVHVAEDIEKIFKSLEGGGEVGAVLREADAREVGAFLLVLTVVAQAEDGDAFGADVGGDEREGDLLAVSWPCETTRMTRRPGRSLSFFAR